MKGTGETGSKIVDSEAKSEPIALTGNEFAGFEYTGFKQFAGRLEESVGKANEASPDILGKTWNAKMENFITALRRRSDMPTVCCDEAALYAQAIDKAVVDFGKGLDPDRASSVAYNARAVNEILIPKMATIEKNYQVEMVFERAVDSLCAFVPPKDRGAFIERTNTI